MPDIAGQCRFRLQSPHHRAGRFRECREQSRIKQLRQLRQFNRSRCTFADFGCCRIKNRIAVDSGFNQRNDKFRLPLQAPRFVERPFSSISLLKLSPAYAEQIQAMQKMTAL